MQLRINFDTQLKIVLFEKRHAIFPAKLIHQRKRVERLVRTRWKSNCFAIMRPSYMYT